MVILLNLSHQSSLFLTSFPSRFGKAFLKYIHCEGDIAQLVEHLLCMQGALGSIPSISKFSLQLFENFVTI